MNSVSYRLLLIVWLLGIGLGLGNLNAGAYAKTQLIRTEAHQYMPLVPVLKTYPENIDNLATNCSIITLLKWIFAGIALVMILGGIIQNLVKKSN